MERRHDWYEHPKYYEAIFGTDTDRELDFLLALGERYGNGGRRWLEPACGAGRLIEAAARAGLSITGYDASEKMLAHARTRLNGALAKRVKLARGRMESFAPASLIGKVDLAFNLVSTFRYLLREEDAVGHLDCVRRMLAPGGIYVLGFHLTDYLRTIDERERWIGRVGAERVVCNTREGLPEARRRVAPMRNRLRVRGPGKDWRIETDWEFRTYDRRQFRKTLAAAGLTPAVEFDFDYDLSRPKRRSDGRLDVVWVLRAATSRQVGAP